MTPQTIIQAVAIITGIPREEITSRFRTFKICAARSLALWGIRQIRPTMSLQKLAFAVNLTDHTAARHSLKRSFELYETNSKFRAMRDKLESFIAQREVGV